MSVATPFATARLRLTRTSSCTWVRRAIALALDRPTGPMPTMPTFIRSLDLQLHRRAGLVGRPRCDDEVTTRGRRIALHDLADGPDGVDDRCAYGIGHERGERLERSAAVGPRGEREHIRLLQ